MSTKLNECTKNELEDLVRHFSSTETPRGGPSNGETLAGYLKRLRMYIRKVAKSEDEIKNAIKEISLNFNLNKNQIK